MPEISVVIPVYNALEDVKILLNSLNRNLDFDISEVILVNDCSNEETSAFLEQFSKENPRYKYLKNEQNLGFVQTCNKGMEFARGNIVILLNSDTEIPEGFCKKVLQCFNSDKNIGIASPVGSSMPVPDGFDTDKMNDLLSSKIKKPKYPLLSAAMGYCYCIRRDVIKQQGYLDTVWGKGYHEEIDYSFRAITNGWKNVLMDNLYVYHKCHASFGKETRKKLIEQNNPEFKKRWEGFARRYERKHRIESPNRAVKRIEKKMFPKGNPARPQVYQSPSDYIFSVKNDEDKSHKVVTICGCRIKLKNCPGKS